MSKKNLLPICLFLLFTAFKNKLTAQHVEPPINSGAILEKAYKYYQNNSIESSIEEFLKIDENDTNYVLSQLELANIYIDNKRDSLALIIANKLKDEPSEYQQSFHIIKASSLENMGKLDEAVKSYKESALLFPKNYFIPYNLGMLYFNKKDYKEAIKYFKQSVAINPHYPKSHLRLGNSSLLTGNTVEALLSYQFYLLLETNKENALESVVRLEKFVKGEYNDEITKSTNTEKEEDDFSELASLIESKVALKSGYKSKIKLQYDVVKQIQLLFEKLKYNKGDKGFWMQTYVPFFTELYKNNYYETFVYTIMSSVENKKIDKWIKKHGSDIYKMRTWSSNYLAGYLTGFEEDMNGTRKKVRHFYNNNNKPIAEGNIDANENPIDYWKYYYNNLVLASEGAYLNSQKDGLWKTYYNEGMKSELMHYKNGKLNGEYTKYYTNGAIDTKSNYVDDLYDGKVEYYYTSGQLKQSLEFKAGKQVGKEIYYHKNGAVKYEIKNILEGEIDGEVKIYYPSGKLQEVVNFTKGKRNGKAVEYYENGNIASEGNYLNNQSIGEWKIYYDSGKIKTTGKQNEKGKYIGNFTSYYENGKIEEETIYSEKGKLIGYKQYNNKGILFNEITYKSEELNTIRSYNLKGELIKETKRNGKTLDAVFYYPNGNLYSEGKFVSDAREGEWKFYNENGTIKSSSTYVNGLLNGVYKNYYKNGAVSSEYNYNNGELEGYYKDYRIGGQLNSEGYYVKGQEEGYWKYYYENGAISEIFYFLNGKKYQKQQSFAVNGKLLNEDIIRYGFKYKIIQYDTLGNATNVFNFPQGSGDYFSYYNNKKVRSKFIYKNGNLEGQYAWYYPNGNMEVEGQFFNDEKTGKVTTYYENGKKLIEENFVNGKLEGSCIRYNEEGKITSNLLYRKGKQYGTQKYFYDNGIASWIGDEEADKINGYSELFDFNGELIIKKYSEDGILLSYQYKDKSGNLVSPIQIKNETAKIIAYFSNGQKSIEYELKNGLLQGKRTEYQMNGKIISDCNYIDGEEDGIKTDYFPNGKIESEYSYKMGTLQGISKTYFENGKLKQEINYVNGLKHGISKTFDESGKLIKAAYYYNNTIVTEN